MTSSLSSNLYMNGVVLEENTRMFGKGLELLRANCGRFEINQLTHSQTHARGLLADDTAPVAYSEEKLCRLVRAFCRLC